MLVASCLRYSFSLTRFDSLRLQDIVRIDNSIEDNALIKNSELVSAVNRAKKGNGRLHLCGLVSDGGVHSHINHLLAFLKIFKELEVPNVFIHFYGGINVLLSNLSMNH